MGSQNVTIQFVTDAREGDGLIEDRTMLAYSNRSGVYHALGQFKEAEADLEKARKIDPGIEKMK